ncbi:hypothetical protein PHIM1EF22_0080 [Enterococcus phage phiM1EF22]|uniref:Structural protein n=1 Tax=Enterococcus phage Sw5 TaxID=2950724 RepID=A0A9E7MHJ2_9CAUD|nr:structural protein [Enterococcus phage Sw5]BBE37281.1 hypothetical protein PHIM1EF22_0080 [Enterococcus phage phiM1EF22]
MVDNNVKISKSTIEGLINKSLSYEYVIKNNELLTNEYQHIVKAYGFDNFYDMYLYADSCDSKDMYLVKGGQKDLSKLKPVKRKVVRNGKTMTTTIYEDTGSSDSNNSNPLDKDSKKKKELEPVNAKELRKVSLGSDEEEKLDPKKIAKLLADTKKFGNNFDTQCTDYLILEQDSVTRGVVGFTREGSYLKMSFSMSDEAVKGIKMLAFSQLTLKAWKLGLGAKISTDNAPDVEELISLYGYKRNKTEYIVSMSSLRSLLGEP